MGEAQKRDEREWEVFVLSLDKAGCLMDYNGHVAASHRTTILMQCDAAALPGSCMFACNKTRMGSESGTP